MIGGFLVLNMIVGVVVENFQKCQELQDKQTKTKVVLDKWKAHVMESRKRTFESQKGVGQGSLLLPVLDSF